MIRVYHTQDLAAVAAHRKTLAMSITSYSERQAALTAWLGHTLLAAQYPDFIMLFEVAVA